MSVPYSEGKNDVMLLERSARARSGICRSMVERPRADMTVSNPSVYRTFVRKWHKEQEGRRDCAWVWWSRRITDDLFR